MKQTSAAKKFDHPKAGVTSKTRDASSGRLSQAKQDTRFRAKTDQGGFVVRDAQGKISSIKKFCDSYGVTRDAVTRMTGFSPRAVANWSSGKPPSPSAQKKLAELTRLFDALSELVESKAIASWLKTSNPSFEGSTPLQVIERGETDRLWRMIWQLETGNSG